MMSLAEEGTFNWTKRLSIQFLPKCCIQTRNSRMLFVPKQEFWVAFKAVEFHHSNLNNSRLPKYKVSWGTLDCEWKSSHENVDGLLKVLNSLLFNVKFIIPTPIWYRCSAKLQETIIPAEYAVYV